MKNKKLYILLALLITLSFIIGFSYAYFTTQVIGNDSASEQYMTAGSLRLNYNGTNAIQFENAVPSNSSTATFTVKNIGTMPVTGYDIYFSQLYNSYINDELLYSLTCTSSDANPCSGISNEPVPNTNNVTMGVKAHIGSTINPGATHTYILKLEFIETGTLQDYNQEAIINFKVTIAELLYGPGIIKTSTGLSDNYAFWGIRDQITEIAINDGGCFPYGCVGYNDNNGLVFLAKPSDPEWWYPTPFDYNLRVESWDISADQNGSVTAFTVLDENHPGMYKLGIFSSSYIYFNPDSSHLFEGFTNLHTVNFRYPNYNADLFRNVENYSSMFKDCTSLTEINGLEFGPNTNNLSSMFMNCTSLTDFYFSRLIQNQLPITNVSSMFEGCSSLNHLDFQFFYVDTNSILYYNNMLYGVKNNIGISTECNDVTADFLEERIADAGLIVEIDRRCK